MAVRPEWEKGKQGGQAPCVFPPRSRGGGNAGVPQLRAGRSHMAHQAPAVPGFQREKTVCEMSSGQELALAWHTDGAAFVLTSPGRREGGSHTGERQLHRSSSKLAFTHYRSSCHITEV